MRKTVPKGFRLYPDIKWRHHRIRFKSRNEAIAFMKQVRRLLGYTGNEYGWWCGSDKRMVGFKKGIEGDKKRWYVIVDTSPELLDPAFDLRVLLRVWKAGRTYQQDHGKTKPSQTRPVTDLFSFVFDKKVRIAQTAHGYRASLNNLSAWGSSASSAALNLVLLLGRTKG